ncbi:MAG: CehA/McbA family metallohydrolase [Halieaceae bacterium]|jgi:hypothetical protein|nr:CehA/McbA family metallohydrolase [Halieaceae bacterium]
MNNETLSVTKLGSYLSLLSLAISLGSSPALAHPLDGISGPTVGQVTAKNARHYRVGGLDAQGGIGDWFISNGVLCAIVSDPSQESALTWQGGFLTDLGFCQHQDDHFLAYYPTIDMALTGIVPMTSIGTSLIGERAAIHAVSEQDGFRLSTTYSMDRESPNIISINSELERTASGKPVLSYSEVLLTADSMPLFTVSSNREATSNGFDHVANAPGAADLTVLLGGGDPGHNIAYGYRFLSAQLTDKQGQSQPIPTAGATGSGFTARLALLNGDLAIGSTLQLQTEITVSRGATVSPVTDALWSEGLQVEGEAGEPDVTILVSDGNGAVTQVVSDETGKFRFMVPTAGDYQALVRARGRADTAQSFSVAGNATKLVIEALQPPAILTLPQNQIMRLSFTGLHSAVDPNFTDSRLGFKVQDGTTTHQPGKSRHLFLSGVPTDSQQVILAPGEYRVTASRGPEFSAHQTTITLESGKTSLLSIPAPTRVLSTPGYISSDFHVHSGVSFDNNLNIHARIKSFVAQGAEVLVATEHDTIYELRTAIADLGLSDRVKTITGTEITTEVGNPTAPYGIGHANVFPLQAQPLQPRRGAPKHENHRWRDIIARLRSDHSNPIVQLNHPRGGPTESASPGLYLSHMAVAGAAYDPYQPLDSPPNKVLVDKNPVTGVRDIDFDLIEVENGNRWGQRYQATRDDWFSLLRQGIPMAAAANSDSHGVNNGSLAGNVRNMVYVGSDSLADYNEMALLQGIRSGNLYGTNGPLLQLSLNGSPMGAMASGGKPVLKLIVDAAPWMNVDHYKLYVNGEFISEASVKVGVVNHVPLTLEQDAFVTVEVTGKITTLSREVIGDVAPFAFSNPIFFDAEGDGKWSPLGLPLPAPED